MTDLTKEQRATIMDACQSISRSADELKAGCSFNGEWPDAGDKAFYEAELHLLGRLTALLAAHPTEQAGADAEDAARYRWLRRQAVAVRNYASGNPNWEIDWALRGESFDAAVDDARTGGKA